MEAQLHSPTCCLYGLVWCARARSCADGPRPWCLINTASYLFNSHRKFEESVPEILDAWPVPAALSQWFPNHRCFNNHLCIGQPFTGLPFHWHMQVHGNMIVHGRKRWFLTKGIPDGGFNPKASVQSWVVNQYPELLRKHGGSVPEGFHDCTTGPGESVFLPAGWYAGVAVSVWCARSGVLGVCCCVRTYMYG